MNLAQPARPASPALAAMAEPTAPVDNDDEYMVQPAQESTEALNVEPAQLTEPATTVDDPNKFAPTQALKTPWRTGDTDITLEKLRQGGVAFENFAAVSRGIQQTCTRTCLPFLYDERDFISYGEAARYIVVKDDILFVYTEQTDPTPIYTVSLTYLQPILENREKPHKASLTISPEPNTNLPNSNMDTILLVDGSNKLVYQVTFDRTLVGIDAAGQFLTVVQECNRRGKGKDVKA